MSWYVASTVNVVPDDKYIFINNSNEEITAAAGYPSSLFTGYTALDIVLVSGGGAGGYGGSGSEGIAGAGGGSGYRVGYIPTTYVDPNTNYVYDYTIASGTSFQIPNYSSYTFDTIIVTLGTGGVSNIPTLTPSNPTTIELKYQGNTVYSMSSNAVSDVNGFNGGGAGSRKGNPEGGGSGDTSNGGENSNGVLGGGIGAGISAPGELWPSGSGAGGSGVKITYNGNIIITGADGQGGGRNGLNGMDYTGAGASGGGYSDASGGNGGKGYAILHFHN